MSLQIKSRPMIIAHRGASADVPENTIAAFERAIELRVDMIEFDVRRTADGVFIVHHDPEVQGQLIANLSWAELAAIAPDVPTLAAVIGCCQGRIRLDVELKEVGDEAEILGLLFRHLSVHEFIMTSFHFESIQRIRSIDPTVVIGLLFVAQSLEKFRDLTGEQVVHPAHEQVREQVREQLMAIGVNFVLPHWSLVDSPLLLQTIPSQMPLIVWTVNQAEMARSLMQRSNVVGIVTDAPQSILSALDCLE